MTSIEVRPAEWRQTLDGFSRVHEGWLVMVDVLSDELGPQLKAKDVRLVGITMDDRPPAVTIAVASSRREQTTHRIRMPARVRLHRTDEGADAALQIEAADGTALLVRLKTAARPETVDGIATPV